MNMILRNLRELWRNERMLLFIMIICVFSSSLLLQFSYGLYQNYHVIRSEAESDLKELRGDIAQDASLTRAEFAAFVEALPRGITDQVDSFFCHGDSGSIPEHIDLTEEQRQELLLPSAEEAAESLDALEGTNPDLEENVLPANP